MIGMKAASFTEKKLQILIVEDNEINCELLVHHLREIATLDIAYTGETAITKARKKKYDLILLDISLGVGKNGVEVFKVLKVQGCNKNTAVIAVTGSVIDSNQEEFLKVGFKGFLSKPFSKQELMDAITRVIP